MNQFTITTYQQWLNLFDPIIDPATGEPKCFETKPDAPTICIWTHCEQGGEEFIDTDYRMVNALHYYVCNRPWPHRNIQVQFEKAPPSVDDVIEAAFTVLLSGTESLEDAKEILERIVYDVYQEMKGATK